MRKLEARANFYLLLLNTTGGQPAQLIDLIAPFSVIVGRELRSDSIVPVSYTHLDVYKRQIHCGHVSMAPLFPKLRG